MMFECLNCGRTRGVPNIGGFTAVPDGWHFSECSGSYDHESETWACSAACVEALVRARQWAEYHARMVWERHWRKANLPPVVSDPNVPRGSILLVTGFDVDPPAFAKGTRF